MNNEQILLLNENSFYTIFKKTLKMNFIFLTLICLSFTYFLHLKNSKNNLLNSTKISQSSFDNKLIFNKVNENNENTLNANKGKTLLRNLIEVNDFFIPFKLDNNSNNYFSYLILADLNFTDYFTINKFLDKISNTPFIGNWTSKSQVLNFESKNGIVEMIIRNKQILTLEGFTKYYIVLLLKIRDGEYIDKWKIVKAQGTLFVNSKFDFNLKTANFSDYNTTLYNGELFDFQIDPRRNYLSDFNMEWTNWYPDLNTNNTIKTIDFSNTHTNSNLNGYLIENNVQNKDSNFDFIKANYNLKEFLNLEVNLEQYDLNKYNVQIIIFSNLISLVGILQLLNNILLIRKIDNNFTNGKSLSLYSMFLNALWNSFTSISLFVLAFQLLNDYMTHFIIPAIIYFINFSVFDIRLLFIRWRMNANNVGANEMINIRREVIRFYLILYFFIFLEIVFLTSILFKKSIIIIIVAITWIPQLYHNTMTRSTTSMPLFSLLTNSVNKLFLPLYIRSPYNFFEVRPDFTFSLFLLFIMGFEVFFIYLQSIFGGIFFLPSNMTNTETFNYYRNKDELISENTEIGKEDCVICLFQLFAERNSNSDFIFNNNIDNNFSKKGFLRRLKDQIIKTNLFFFDFYHVERNKTNKEFMITPCNHVFHSDCLESWLKQKKECPTCRREIASIYL